MEGKGEAEGERVVGEFFDLGGEAAGGDGDVACAHTDVGGGDEEIEGGEEVGEISERFAHAHEDKIVGSASSDAGGFDDLADNFSGGEIAAPTVETAGAEAATIGATDLAGDAEGEAGAAGTGFAEGGRDENRFDEGSIAEFPKEFSGGVFGALDGDGFGGAEAKAGGERGAEGEGEVGHLVVGGDESLEDPSTNLFFAVGLVGGQIPRGYGLIEEQG